MKVANHERFRKHVRVVDYDARYFGDYDLSSLTRIGLWYQQVGRGMGFDELERQDLLSQFNYSVLQEAFARWEEWICGEEFLFRRNHVGKVMAYVLPKLPALMGLRFHAIGKDYEPDSEQKVDRYQHHLGIHGSTARWILCEPSNNRGDMKGYLHNWDLLELACQSGHLPQLTKLSMSDTDIVSWDKEAARFMDSDKSLPALRDLTLDFNHYSATSSPDPTTNLSKFIKASPALRTLQLYFATKTQLTAIINPETRLNNLKDLSIHALMTTEAQLRQFLLKHASTLRFLNLANLHFKNSGNDKVQDHRSLVSFFQFLNQSLYLEEASFDGDFSNYRTKDGRVGLPGLIPRTESNNFQTEFPPDCLKYKIERFVTRNGPFPFLRCDGKNAKHCVWEGNSESSWSFGPDLIVSMQS